MLQHRLFILASASLASLLMLSFSIEASAQSKYPPQQGQVAVQPRVRLGKSVLTVQQRKLMKLANIKFGKIARSRTRFLSRDAKARAMRIPGGRVGPSFDLSARSMYRFGKGSLSAYGAVVSGKDDRIQTYSGDHSSVRIQMERARPGKLYLVECTIAAGRTPVSFTMLANGYSLTKTVPAGQTQNIAFPFMPARADEYVFMGPTNGTPSWQLVGCRITAEN